MALRVHKFTFNPFSENTYLLISENNKAAIFDPGIYDTNERAVFLNYLKEEGIELIQLINTHCHLDHVFGNAFIAQHFGLPLQMHKDDLVTLAQAEKSASLYGLNFEQSPEPEIFLEHGQVIDLDGSSLEIRHCPGHCPGHIVFVAHEEQLVIGGDVLFEGSVGRVDLPGGNAADLDRSIREQLYTLPDNYRVHPGHGNATTIGKEKKSNPFVFEGGSGLL